MKKRNHWFILISYYISMAFTAFSFLIATVIFIPLGIQGITENTSPLIAFLMYAAIAIIVIIIILGSLFIPWYLYKNRYYMIGEETIEIGIKTIFRTRKKNINYTEVSTVEINQTLIHRIFDVNVVKINTSSSESSTTNDFQIYVRTQEAVEIEAYVKERQTALKERQKQKVVEEQTNVEEVQEKPEEVQTFDKDEFEIPISNVKIIMYYALDIAFHELSGVLVALIIAAVSFPALGIFPMLIGIITLASVVFLRVDGVLNYCAKYYSNEIIVKYGIISSKKYTIEKTKIKFVEIEYSRIFKRYSVFVKVVGLAQKTGNNDQVITKFPIIRYGKEAELEKVLNQIGYSEINGQEYKLKKNVQIIRFITGVIFDIFLYIVSIAALKGLRQAIINSSPGFEDLQGLEPYLNYIMGFIIILFILGLVIKAILKIINFIIESVFLTENIFVHKQGVLKMVKKVVKYKEIQSYTATRGPLDRILGTFKLNFSLFKTGTNEEYLKVKNFSKKLEEDFKEKYLNYMNRG